MSNTKLVCPKCGCDEVIERKYYDQISCFTIDENDNIKCEERERVEITDDEENKELFFCNNSCCDWTGYPNDLIPDSKPQVIEKGYIYNHHNNKKYIVDDFAEYSFENQRIIKEKIVILRDVETGKKHIMNYDDFMECTLNN